MNNFITCRVNMYVPIIKRIDELRTRGYFNDKSFSELVELCLKLEARLVKLFVKGVFLFFYKSPARYEQKMKEKMHVDKLLSEKIELNFTRKFFDSFTKCIKEHGIPLDVAINTMLTDLFFLKQRYMAPYGCGPLKVDIETLVINSSNKHWWKA